MATHSQGCPTLILRTAKWEAGCEVSEAPSQLYVRFSEMQRKKVGWKKEEEEQAKMTLLYSFHNLPLQRLPKLLWEMLNKWLDANYSCWKETGSCPLLFNDGNVNF